MVKCPSCNADFAYQSLLSIECPSKTCRYYTERQSKEAVDLFVKKIEEEKEASKIDDHNPLWMLGYNSD